MSGAVRSYELAFEERAQYLYAEITSKAISLERSALYLSEVAKRCREVAAKRLLVERHIPQTLSNVDVYKAVNALVDLLPPGIRIALVDSHINNRKRLEFGVRAARSQHLDAEVFSTVEAAEKWLLRGA